MLLRMIKEKKESKPAEPVMEQKSPDEILNIENRNQETTTQEVEVKRQKPNNVGWKKRLIIGIKSRKSEAENLSLYFAPEFRASENSSAPLKQAPKVDSILAALRGRIIASRRFTRIAVGMGRFSCATYGSYRGLSEVS